MSITDYNLKAKVNKIKQQQQQDKSEDEPLLTEYRENLQNF